MKKIIKILTITLFYIFKILIILFACAAIYLWIHIQHERPKNLKTQIVEKNEEYAANKDKQCSQRANPVRFEINRLVFKIPTELFNVYSLKRCWGSGFYGAAVDCTDDFQPKKVFIDKTTGKEKEGFCQNDEDPPFLLDFIRLNFESFYKENAKFSLKPNENLVEITAQLKKLRITEADHYELRNYCKKDSMNEKMKFFNNPVNLMCVESRKEKNKKDGKFCKFKGLIGNNVIIFQNDYFSEKEMPFEYWPAYLQEIESLLSGFLIETPDSQYPEVCNKFREKK